MNVIGNYEMYVVVKKHADEGLPEAQLAVGEYLIAEGTSNEFSSRGLDPSKNAATAYDYLYKAATAPDFENAGHAYEAMGRIQYYPRFQFCDMEKALALYDRAYKAYLQFDKVDEAIPCMRMCVDLCLILKDLAKANEYAADMLRSFHAYSGMTDFAVNAFEYGDASEGYKLLMQLVNIGSMDARFALCRLLCPEPGETFDSDDLKQLFTDNLMHLAGAVHDNTNPHRFDFASIVYYYYYTADPAKFAVSRYYKALTEGASKHNSMWCMYYLGLYAMEEMRRFAGLNDEVNFNKMYELAAFCLRTAADYGLRPAIKGLDRYMVMTRFEGQFAEVWHNVIVPRYNAEKAI